MARRHRIAALIALGTTLAIVGPTNADTGPNQPTTNVDQVLAPYAFLGTDGRSYEGTIIVQRDNLTGVATGGFWFSWRNLVPCDNGTPEPEDDFDGQELIDFTVDSITPTSFTLATDLSSSTGTLTGTGRRVHYAACDGAVLADVVETHTISYTLASTGRATRSSSRERIPNDDGTVTTIVVRELHRPAGGTFDLDGVAGSITGADLSHVEVTETTR
jgi:hypothetical protein